jgi:chorismate mutase
MTEFTISDHEAIARKIAEDTLKVGRAALEDNDRDSINLIAERLRIVASLITPSKITLDLPAFVPDQHFRVIADRREMAVQLGAPPELVGEYFGRLVLPASVGVQQIDMRAKGRADLAQQSVPNFNQLRVAE